jgi:hypothetical protein
LAPNSCPFADILSEIANFHTAIYGGNPENLPVYGGCELASTKQVAVGSPRLAFSTVIGAKIAAKSGFLGRNSRKSFQFQRTLSNSLLHGDFPYSPTPRVIRESGHLPFHAQRRTRPADAVRRSCLDLLSPLPENTSRLCSVHLPLSNRRQPTAVILYRGCGKVN